MGYCANDPQRSPVPADGTRSCWEAAGADGPGSPIGTAGAAGHGLFDEADIVPPAPAAPRPVPAPPSVRTKPDRERRRSRPSLEVPGRAAWVEPESDALVEAPLVEPGKRLTTEVQRRRRRWFR